MQTEPYLIFRINWLSYFLAKYASHCPFFDYRYGSKGSTDVKNKIRCSHEKSNFGKKNFVGEKYLLDKNFRRLKIFVG